MFEVFTHIFMEEDLFIRKLMKSYFLEPRDFILGKMLFFPVTFTCLPFLTFKHRHSESARSARFGPSVTPEPPRRNGRWRTKCCSAIIAWEVGTDVDTTTAVNLLLCFPRAVTLTQQATVKSLSGVFKMKVEALLTHFPLFWLKKKSWNLASS